jgi:hypothetical protein
MSATTPRSVISGKPYPVVQVDDRAPATLDDFTGETTFLIDLDGQSYLVSGPGVPVEDGVRVFEKSEHGVGKDIRTWLVCPSAHEASFVATHLGIDVPAQAVKGALT